MLLYELPFDEQECSIVLDAVYYRSSEVQLRAINASGRTDGKTMKEPKDQEWTKIGN